MRTISGRVGPTLGVLAVVPLAGLTLLALSLLNDIRTTNSQLSQLDEQTGALVQLVELEAALQNEAFWVAAEYGVVQTGVTPEMAVALLGIDPFQSSRDARARTDDLVETVDLPGLDEEVEQARATPPDLLSQVQDQELIASVRVSGLLGERVRTVVALAAEQPEAPSLFDLARTLERANSVRSDFSELRSAFFASYGTVEAPDEAQARVVSNQLYAYELQLEALGQLVDADSAVAGSFELLTSDQDRLHLIEQVQSLLADFGSEETAGSRSPLDPARLNAVASTFPTADVVSRRHLTFVETSAAALQAEIGGARARAQRRAWLLGSLTAAVSLITIGAIVATTRWIVRPLSDLGRTAHALTEGGLGPLPTPRGPTEIRQIHEALDVAVSNLERAEQQAIALADGELDDPSLDQPVPGRIGATLHAAIEQLRESIGDREEFSERLAFEAAHDGLTGLCNRRAALDFLRQALEAACETGALTTVFFVDLDHFKVVNDARGHAEGDKVLRSAAKALRHNARPGDMVGRIGGDEFLVVSTALTHVEQATKLAQRFLTALKPSIATADNPIGASIGVAVGEPGRNVDALLAEADVAMLEAKRQGRDGFRLFDAELQGRTLEEERLSAGIRAGLELDEFSLHLQPIVDAVTGSVLDYEALIRWDRPGHGAVPPDAYIPFAERSDLVIEIDRWVLAEAIGIIASGVLDGVGIAVNISGRHLATGDLFRDLEAALLRKPIDRSHLTIEITESALLGDIDGAIETLRRIREAGVKIAIDDFGTGFTSLTHLRRLPADVLKIDQTFTSNLHNADDANLIRLVIQTAHLLGLDVVVEGVETLHQAQRVTMLGADQMQGYFFAKPTPVEQIVRADNGRPITTSPTTSRR